MSWTVADGVAQDKRYLTPIIDNVVKEDEERAMWDSMKVERQKKT